MRQWIALLLLWTSGLAAADGYQVVYRVQVKGPVPVSVTETITVCGDRMRMVLGDDRELLFDRSVGKAWDIRRTAGVATEYDFEQNRPFFDRFLVPFAAVTGQGALVFPENIFRTKGRRVTVHDREGMEVELPGRFLQSRSTAVIPVAPGPLSGEKVAAFYGFFTRNHRLLDQMRLLKGFPLRLTTIVSLNGTRTITDRELVSGQPIQCDVDSLALPEGITVRSAPPEGVPLMLE